MIDYNVTINNTNFKNIFLKMLIVSFVQDNVKIERSNTLLKEDQIK